MVAVGVEPKEGSQSREEEGVGQFADPCIDHAVDTGREYVEEKKNVES